MPKNASISTKAATRSWCCDVRLTSEASSLNGSRAQNICCLRRLLPVARSTRLRIAARRCRPNLILLRHCNVMWPGRPSLRFARRPFPIQKTEYECCHTAFVLRPPWWGLLHGDAPDRQAATIAAAGISSLCRAGVLPVGAHQNSRLERHGRALYRRIPRAGAASGDRSADGDGYRAFGAAAPYARRGHALRRLRPVLLQHRCRRVVRFSNRYRGQGSLSVGRADSRRARVRTGQDLARSLARRPAFAALLTRKATRESAASPGASSQAGARIAGMRRTS